MLLILAFSSIAAAQPAAPSKCPGGTLIGARDDLIVVRMNQKTELIRIKPGAEIWTRGRDVDSTAELTLGTQVFAVCEQVGGDGVPVAALVVAAQGEDSVKLIPHQVQEDRSCGGTLLSTDGSAVTLRTDEKKRLTVRVTSETTIWRGEISHDTSRLRRGDKINGRCVVHFPDEALTAEELWANMWNTEGTIAKVTGDEIVIDQYPGADKQSAYPRGPVTVTFDDRTNFVDCTRADLQPGRNARVTGTAVNRSKFRAASIHIDPK